MLMIYLENLEESAFLWVALLNSFRYLHVLLSLEIGTSRDGAIAHIQRIPHKLNISTRFRSEYIGPTSLIPCI